MNEILNKLVEEEADYLTQRLYNGFFKTNCKSFFESGAQYALSHQWISVDEALPENDDWVIVMYDNGLMEVRKGIYVRFNRPFAESLKITHWLLIPKLEMNGSNENE